MVGCRLAKGRLNAVVVRDESIVADEQVHVKR